MTEATGHCRVFIRLDEDSDCVRIGWVSVFWSPGFIEIEVQAKRDAGSTVMETLIRLGDLHHFNVRQSKRSKRNIGPGFVFRLWLRDGRRSSHRCPGRGRARLTAKSTRCRRS